MKIFIKNIQTKILRTKIKSWLFNMNINNYNINDDLTVDVKENVYLTNKNLNEIPVQFGIVHGDFHCNKNNLISLYGSPKTVIGEFNCSENNLSTLKFCPTIIEGLFNCVKNPITELNLNELPQEAWKFVFQYKGTKIKYFEDYYQEKPFPEQLIIELDAIKANLLKNKLDKNINKQNKVKKIKI